MKKVTYHGDSYPWSQSKVTGCRITWKKKGFLQDSSQQQIKKRELNQRICHLGVARSSAGVLASLLHECFFQNSMVGCQYGHEIWHRLEVYFASHTKVKVK